MFRQGDAYHTAHAQRIGAVWALVKDLLVQGDVRSHEKVRSATPQQLIEDYEVERIHMPMSSDGDRKKALGATWVAASSEPVAKSNIKFCEHARTIILLR